MAILIKEELKTFFPHCFYLGHCFEKETTTFRYQDDKLFKTETAKLIFFKSEKHVLLYTLKIECLIN